jgi:tRNA dimethylallyltransferase
MAKDALVITGPTATGKTAVAIEVALRLDGEVISLDSRQVYRGMNVGTAKPALGERRGVPHHGFDVVAPNERFNAGRFADLARSWITQIRTRRRVPILAGGTGFFLRALTHPLFTEPALPEPAKERWKSFLRTLDTPELARWAAALDPGAHVRREDRQRLARVIEVAVLTGHPLSSWHRSAPPAAAPIDPLIFVLDLPRDVLYRRIEERVERMAEQGLVAEVRALLDAGYDAHDPGMNATGYIELIPYFRGAYSLPEALALVKAATRRYARRQHTWLRHQLPPNACRLNAEAGTEALADAIVHAWTQGHR